MEDTLMECPVYRGIIHTNVGYVQLIQTESVIVQWKKTTPFEHNFKGVNTSSLSLHQMLTMQREPTPDNELIPSIEITARASPQMI